MDRVVLSWSGGKDAAFALHALRQSPDAAVEELLTTVSAGTDRVTVHGVRRSLLERQAAAVGLPVRVVELPPEPTNETYERVMADAMADYESRGFDRVAFADLHLDDVRAYREDRLADAGLDGLWPLWGRDTRALVRAFADAGFRATVVVVDGSVLDRRLLGRAVDRSLVADLPDGVDPCGEHGEFHTFVRDGPVFEAALAIEPGEVVTREVGDSTLHYLDLRAADSTPGR